MKKFLFLAPLALLAGCGSVPEQPELTDSDMLQMVHKLSEIAQPVPHSYLIVTHKDGSLFRVSYRHPNKGAMGNAVAKEGHVSDVPYQAWFQNHFGHNNFKSEGIGLVGPGHPEYRKVSDDWRSSVHAPI